MSARLAPIRPDLGLHWCVFLDTTRGDIPLSTVLLRLRDGSLLAYSPTAGMGDEIHAEIAALGPVSVLLCPNHFHHMGVGEWQARHPEAVVCASPRAARRLAKKAAVAPDPAAWERLPERLPEHARVLLPEGTSNGEAWLELDDTGGPLWVVCDAWFNMPQHLRGVVGLICRWLRVTGGLLVGTSWKWLALADRAGYRDWVLAALEERRPVGVVPSHGEIVEGVDAVERLRGALVERLGRALV